jgi:hypothetical protein
MKLRNATTQVGQMAQYLARKCVIHSPQAELDMTEDERRKKGQRFGKNKHYEGARVHMLRDTDSPQFVAISPGGRAMVVTVEEVDLDTLDEADFKEVGP